MFECYRLNFVDKREHTKPSLSPDDIKTELYVFAVGAIMCR